MSTNYYANINKCEFCGRSDTVHLGQNAVGWKFLLQANEYKYYKSWKEMKIWIIENKFEIRDEYSRDVSIQDFINHVESKQELTSRIDHFNQLFKIMMDREGFEFYNGEFS